MVKEQTPGQKQRETIDRYFDTLPDESGNKPLDVILAKLENHEIQTMLGELEQEMLQTALPGLSKASQRKLLGNLSDRLTCLIISEIGQYTPDEAEQAHVAIIGLYQRLLRDGKVGK